MQRHLPVVHYTSFVIQTFADGRLERGGVLLDVTGNATLTKTTMAPKKSVEQLGPPFWYAQPAS
jgi:hypothetical protein